MCIGSKDPQPVHQEEKHEFITSGYSRERRERERERVKFLEIYSNQKRDKRVKVTHDTPDQSEAVMPMS